MRVVESMGDGVKHHVLVGCAEAHSLFGHGALEGVFGRLVVVGEGDERRADSEQHGGVNFAMRVVFVIDHALSILQLEERWVHRDQSRFFLLHVQIFNQPSTNELLNVDRRLEVLLLQQDFVAPDNQQRSAASATISQNLDFTTIGVLADRSKMRDDAFPLGPLENVEDIFAFAGEAAPVAIHAYRGLVLYVLEIGPCAVVYYLAVHFQQVHYLYYLVLVALGCHFAEKCKIFDDAYAFPFGGLGRADHAEVGVVQQTWLRCLGPGENRSHHSAQMR